MRNDPGFGQIGAPAVTGAEGPSPSVEGNGAAVDFRGDLTKSEGVVWGQVVVALRDDDTLRRTLAPIRTKMGRWRSIDGGAPPALRGISLRPGSQKG